MQAGKIKFRMKQELQVQDAVGTLQARGLQASTAAVAAYIGKSYRYLRKAEQANTDTS